MRREIGGSSAIGMKQPRITVVGSVNVDMVVRTSRLPAPGETVTGGRFIMAPGGKGANQAVAAARLGADAMLIAKIGQDLFGDEAIATYRRERIRTECVIRDPEYPTGVALIMVNDQEENLISVASGANHRLTPVDVERCCDQILRGRPAPASVGNPNRLCLPGCPDRCRGRCAGDSRPGAGNAAATGVVEMRRLSHSQRSGGATIDGHRGRRRGIIPTRR